VPDERETGMTGTGHEQASGRVDRSPAMEPESGQTQRNEKRSSTLWPVGIAGECQCAAATNARPVNV
jgi:hypothetical protein